MLDQNTDRMWFVIGAVIVGAAIIFIANGSLPTLFASVADSFEDGANKGIAVVEDIDIQVGNLIDLSNIEYHTWYSHEDGLSKGSLQSGLDFATAGPIKIVPGRSYIFRTKAVTHNKRIVFYDVNDVIIPIEGGRGTQAFIRAVAPANARTARISTAYANNIFEGHMYATPDQWWFGQG